jgi:hypothetical protein
LAGRSYKVIYAVNKDGSAFSAPDLLAGVAVSELSALRHLDRGRKGLTAAMLYVAVGGSTFAVHVEEADLLALNYLHWGAVKIWYIVPGDEAERLERVVAGLPADEAEAIAAVAAAKGNFEPVHAWAPFAAAAKKELKKAFADAAAKGLPDDRAAAAAVRAVTTKSAAQLARKATMPCPTRLRAAGVTVRRLEQHPGDLVVTYERAYHWGFSCGVSVGEAINLGDLRWLEHAVAAAERWRQQQAEHSVPVDLVLARELAAMRARETPSWLVDRATALHACLTSARARLLDDGAEEEKERTLHSADDQTVCTTCKSVCFGVAAVSLSSEKVWCARCVLEGPATRRDRWKVRCWVKEVECLAAVAEGAAQPPAQKRKKNLKMGKHIRRRRAVTPVPSKL